MFVHRTRTMAVATLALLNVFTLGAGAAVAHMLPPRLAALRIPSTANGPLIAAAPVLARSHAAAGLPTAAAAERDARRGAAAADTGPGSASRSPTRRPARCCTRTTPSALATPASTTKLMTALAALAALGPDARFTTAVRQQKGTIVLVGGGDPTLAVNQYPSSDYPQPATLAALAASAARALRAQGRDSVRLDYDTSLYRGPDMAPGWTDGDVSTGNVTPIVALEADQGRLTPSGALQDSDDPVNYSARTMDPAGLTAAAFAGLLKRDGITVTGAPGARHRVRLVDAARERDLAHGGRDRRADAAGVQQRHRREPGQARGDRAGDARHVQRRGRRGDDRGPPPGRDHAD